MALNDGSRLNMSSKPLGCFIGGRGGVYPKTSSQAMAGGYCCIDFDSLQLKDGWDGSFAGMVHGMHSRCTCSARMAECFFCGGGRPFFWCCEQLSIGDVIYFPCCNAPILV